MERNRLYFAFFDSRKPLEILNFSDGRFQNGIPISRLLRRMDFSGI